MKRLKNYFLDDTLDFGKYLGHPVWEVYKFVPSYLEWCIENVDFFYTNIDILKLYLTPTPMNLSYFKFGERELWVTNKFPDKNYILEARHYLSLGNTIQEEQFEFSEMSMMQYRIKKTQIQKEINEDSGLSKDYYDNGIDDYGSSYKKYNGYNGYSDDVIDDAFDGDPSNSWNID